MPIDVSALYSALGDRYRIDREIGHGATATVFAAEDLKHHRRVAIKVLSPELAITLGPERFLREIEVAARLSHPHIVPLYDSGAADGFLFYVMPLVDGESLRQRLRRDMQLSVDEALRIAGEVADALAYAHAQGFVHRDIKPENLLLSGGHAFVADFGIARALEAAGGGGLTQTGVAIGTPAYMSPEQASGNGRLDDRSDLYSLGCVLYEMLGGRPPFLGPVESVIYRHVSAEPPRLEDLRSGLPPGVTMLVARLLAKSPTDRPPSANAVRAELQTALMDPHRRRHGARRRVIAIAAIVLVAIGIGVAILMRMTRHPARGSIQSLAVMPLENLSGDASQDYLAAGVTEELINHLSQIGSLRVISRESVMSLRGRNLPVQRIAKSLNVDAVLEGSVVRAGDRVRLTAELVQASPERELWSRSLEREIRDILAVPAELATTIADELRLRLSPRERTRITQTRHEDPKAHDAYLQARYYLGKRNEAAYRSALQYFEHAVQIDSTDARSWAGIAEANYWLSNLYLPPRVAIPTARAAAEHALRLDRELPEAHALLGIIGYVYDWEWAASEREFQTALALNPSLELAHRSYGYFLEATGRFDDAAAQLRQAVALDPLNTELAAEAVWPLYLAGRDDQAIAAWQRLLVQAPDESVLLYNLGMALEAAGRYPEAIALLEKAVIHSDFTFPQAVLCHAYAQAGRRQDALAMLHRLLHGTQPAIRAELAIAYAGLGDKTQALRCLNEALDHRDEELVYVNVDPKLASLHGDPRFHDVLKRMHLEG